MLRQTAERLETPTALQLRLFQTLAEISSERSSTLIVPVPMDLFRPYLQVSDDSGDHHAQQLQQRSQAALHSAGGEERPSASMKGP